ncbi:esterase/lipase family protein [Maricurvus nonylphenolicus]|uniref:esterase/lipase family protein n=1 Tax=Maricurvus nonylphenolicus TaxID=1008307 RepID=UPI0036F426CA
MRARNLSTAMLCLLMWHSAPAAYAIECVVLLHGLARTSHSMDEMAQHLVQAGYAVANINYPSRDHTIAELAPMAINEGIERCNQQDAHRIHFVTHSLGGILVRQYLASSAWPANNPELGRVVMLGPPNQGSEIVDNLKDIPGYELWNGPAGNQLGTDANSIPRQLGPVNFELGVIAGTDTMNPLLSQYLPGPNDGKVSVISTKVEGMTDFISLPTTHTFMMNNDEVISQATFFLMNGRFDHQTP